MTRTWRQVEEYGSLGLLLLVVAAVVATVITSCGGGGGGSNGELCDQCGVSPDGPCQASAFVVPGATEPQPCPSVDSTNPNGCVSVPLICRRKVDSAQQRCYPEDPTTNDLDFQFRCDGSRPGGTALPEPTQTVTPSPAGTPVCGNGTVEGTEQCDTTNLNGEAADCSSLCTIGGGILSCTNCLFDFSACLGAATCSAP
jgi:cysteine-rich repeat protein